MLLSSLYPSVFYPLEKAESMAKQLSTSDPDWEYRVIDCGNGLAKVEVYDEAGAYVGQL